MHIKSSRSLGGSVITLIPTQSIMQVNTNIQHTFSPNNNISLPSRASSPSSPVSQSAKPLVCPPWPWALEVSLTPASTPQSPLWVTELSAPASITPLAALASTAQLSAITDLTDLAASTTLWSVTGHLTGLWVTEASSAPASAVTGAQPTLPPWSLTLSP